MRFDKRKRVRRKLEREKNLKEKRETEENGILKGMRKKMWKIG